MLKTLMAQIRQYKKSAVLAPLCTAGEVLMEVLIPFVTAAIIDQGIEAGNMNKIYQYGALMLVLALFSLCFGVLAARFSARASAGFACNLRDAMYCNVQTFSFSNIDKFSTAGLVTRMTTDVTNLQNAFQMILRVAARAPLMLLCSMFMCFFINVQLSLIFLVAIVVLGAALAAIMLRTTPIFDKVFRKYDDLNASVQENVSAIRVVKAFVRETFENEKFKKAAENLYRMFVKAEKLLALNNPIMMLVVYSSILGLSWFGAHFIVAGSLTTGELTSLLSYVMSVLMSLMMLSMVFVMITMSTASAERIAEVLTETPDLTQPEKIVLHNINLFATPGQKIAFVGSTGAGKTTITNLINRFYDIADGKIRYDGININKIKKGDLRRSLGIVLQDTQMNVHFDGRSGPGHGLFHRGPVGHGADGALFGGDQVGRRIGKPEHLVQVGGGEALQAVFQHKVQDAGAEGIPCAGGLDDPAQSTPGLEGVPAAIEGIAAGGPRRHVQQADVGILALQHGRALGEVLPAGHEQQLIVRNLEDIALAQAPGDLGPGLLQAGPEGFPQVGVKGDPCAGLFGQGHRLLGGGAAGFPGEGQGAEVEDPAVPQQSLVQVRRRQVGVGARLAVKAEIPVSSRQGLDNGQGGGNLGVKPEGPGVDARLLHHLGQLAAKAVPAHLAHEGAALVQLPQHGQHVAGRAAGVGLKEAVALFTEAVLGEIHQQFPQGHHVKSFPVHSASSCPKFRL